MLLSCFQHKQWYHPWLLSHHLPHRVGERGRMNISTKLFLFFGHTFFVFPLWPIFSIAWIPTTNETSPAGAFSRPPQPPTGVCLGRVHEILVQHWHCFILMSSLPAFRWMSALLSHRDFATCMFLIHSEIILMESPPSPRERKR